MIKRPAKYKQLAFDTAIRNPERYKGILVIFANYENQILNDNIVLDIVCNLYLQKEVKSAEIEIKDNTTINDIKQDVIKVNSTRNADGGFPKGYQSRFWTYCRTLSEFGFIYARYNKDLKLSNIAKKLINNEIDEQEAFSIQAMKYNRKSPYRNVSNDYNYFKFILEILLKQELSYNDFVLTMYSKNTEDFNTNHIEILPYIREYYKDNNKEQTILRDYPDVVLRILRITGFITLKYKGQLYITLNENKKDYINDLLKIDFSYTEQEKENDLLYFERANKNDTIFLNIVYKYRDKDVLKESKYRTQLDNIINAYNLNADLMIEHIDKFDNISMEFKYIPDPLKLEFYITLLLYIKYNREFTIKPNYKVDSMGAPISHAPANIGDIELYNDSIYWLIEVTLIKSKIQQLNNETTSVIRHFISNTKQNNYLSFIAPLIHVDTKEFYDLQILKLKLESNNNIFIKSYSIGDFVKIEKHLVDMQKYTEQTYNNLKSKIK